MLKRGIFYNSRKAQCSIYESGLMAYKALALSSNYTLEYREFPHFLNDASSFDFVVFNWHHVTLALAEKEITLIKCPTYTIVTECAPSNPIILTPDWFNGYLVLDPTVQDSGKIWGMPRPLEAYTPESRAANDIPVIGSFGFATVGKRFDLIIEEANKHFDRAIIRFNIPAATYCEPTVHLELANSLTALAKPGIDLIITHNYFTNEQLIGWCAQNDLNVFFYYRNMAGLSAVTDQAISSQQPLLVTEDYTFRHIHPYMESYPKVSIKEALGNKDAVARLYADWHPSKFAEKFERILANG